MAFLYLRVTIHYLNLKPYILFFLFLLPPVSSSGKKKQKQKQGWARGPSLVNNIFFPFTRSLISPPHTVPCLATYMCPIQSPSLQSLVGIQFSVQVLDIARVIYKNRNAFNACWRNALVSLKIYYP